MSYKSTDETLKKVGDDEPIFVLRGNDSLAPAIIASWVWEALEAGVSHEKVAEVEHLIDVMEAYQKAHPDRVKIPD